jgi:hypothetical protein
MTVLKSIGRGLILVAAFFLGCSLGLSTLVLLAMAGFWG